MSFSYDPRLKSIELPCGKCIGCATARAEMWALRCVHEARMHEENCFVTLTYDDANLKRDVVIYRDFQLFLKRLRKAIAPRKIRYFAVGEYGSRTKRPHFHFLCFGVDFRIGGVRYNSRLFEHPIVTSAWKRGRALIGELTAASAAYVAQYAQKKWQREDVDEETGLVREPVFGRSQGIGRAWYDRFGKTDLRHGFASFNGRRISIPRYYLKRLEKEDPERYEAIKALRLARAELIPLEERRDERRAVAEQVAHARRAFFLSLKGEVL